MQFSLLLMLPAMAVKLASASSLTCPAGLYAVPAPFSATSTDGKICFRLNPVVENRTKVEERNEIEGERKIHRRLATPTIRTTNLPLNPTPRPRTTTITNTVTTTQSTTTTLTSTTTTTTTTFPTTSPATSSSTTSTRTTTTASSTIAADASCATYTETFAMVASSYGSPDVDGNFALLQPAFGSGYRVSFSTDRGNAQQFRLAADCSSLISSDGGLLAMIGGEANLHYVYLFPSVAAASAMMNVSWEALQCSVNADNTLSCTGMGQSIFQVTPGETLLQLGNQNYGEAVTINLVPVPVEK